VLVTEATEKPLPIPLRSGEKNFRHAVILALVF
jgi:hypothetical protein